ncbi:MAG: ABC transporter ATP-binding protein [Clostridia bacterium]|jgi:ABC-type multidrug transport system fused ATPase/permease subunit|nr:ABC transporter ATP-binding protein [Clostridia bacterium]
MSVIRFGLSYWKKYIPLFLLSQICSLAAILCDLALPLFSAGIIDYVIACDPANPPAQTGNLFAFLYTGNYGAPGTWQLFAFAAIVFCGVLLARILLIYIKNVTFQWCGLQMENALREDTYVKLLELDGETLSHYNMGELLTAMNRDTIIFKDLFSRVVMNLFDSVCVIAISVIVLTSFDYKLLFLPVIIAPLFAVSLSLYLKKAHALFKEIRAGYSELNLAVQENIGAVRIVRSFAGEETEMRKFDAGNRKVQQLNDDQIKLTAKYNSVFTAFQQIGYVGTVIAATLLVLSGQIYLGALTAATTYVTKIISHITQISRSCFAMQNQLVSGGRLQRFLNETGRVPDYPSSLVPSRRPDIQLQDVGLVLGEKQVLSHICLNIPYGKKVGIMGGTGSGKSALVKSLSRIYDVTSGEILLDGKNIKEYSLDALRAEFSYVFQDVFLFSNTVDANIAFAQPECDEQTVLRAAETAQAARFIEHLESGYQTIVGERGLGLSGGQKQRVSIARALVKNAPVMILDDASSALDMATERRVLSSLKAEAPEQTLIIVAHRVSSVLDCDEILYLRDGEVLERGTARELIEQNGAFAAVYRMQTSDCQLDDSSYGKEEL